jgi:hypothetical protein
VSEEAQAADSLLIENAELRQRLDDVMRAGDLEHARMAAIVEACEAFAAFVESYGPDTALALDSPTFYGIFRVYGKNARAAVGAVRRQADALLAELAAARAALAWYADVGNYDERFAPGVLDPQQGTWHVDCGSRARAALSDAPNDPPL